MPSIKDLKKRITSVKNTQQTTKAMKMVSAAKLRRATEAIQNQRPYAKRIQDLIRLTASLLDPDFTSPVFPREEELISGSASGKASGKKLLLVVITSDRGLCGGFNSAVIKMAQRWLKEHEAEYSSVEMAFVGRKGYEFFKNRKATIAAYYPDLGGKVTFTKGKKLADAIVEMYTLAKVDEVKFVYNEFKNAASQTPRVEDFLPVRPASPNTSVETEGNDLRTYIITPNQAALFSQLIEKNFGIQAFRYLLESQAGEHGARMSAMENATKNAGEMIRKLTLQYNKQRQASITKELLEIISGSEALKG